MNTPAMDFSLFLAYLLPGFVGVYGLHFVSEWMKNVFQALLSKDSSVGAAFIISLASVAVGAIISAARDLTLDRIQYKTGVTRPPESYARLTDPNVLNAFREAINNTYRYAQFYGNMAIALLLCLILGIRPAAHPVHIDPYLIVLVVGAMLVLLVNHRRRLDECSKKLTQILSDSKVMEASAK